MIRGLVRLGFSVDHRKGSHVVLKDSASGARTVVVPDPGARSRNSAGDTGTGGRGPGVAAVCPDVPLNTPRQATAAAGVASERGSDNEVEHELGDDSRMVTATPPGRSRPQGVCSIGFSVSWFRSSGVSETPVRRRVFPLRQSIMSNRLFRGDGAPPCARAANDGVRYRIDAYRFSHGRHLFGQPARPEGSASAMEPRCGDTYKCNLFGI